MCNILSNSSSFRRTIAPLALTLGLVLTLECSGQISNGQAGTNPQQGGDISNVQTVNKGQQQQTGKPQSNQTRTRGQNAQTPPAAKKSQTPVLPDVGNAAEKQTGKKSAGQLGKPKSSGQQLGKPGAGTGAASSGGGAAAKAKRWEIGVRYEQTATGVRVTALRRGGAADRARLERGDVIVAVGGFQVGKVGEKVFKLEEELNQRANAQGHVRVLLQNYRDKRLMSFLVQLDEVKVASAVPGKQATGKPATGKTATPGNTAKPGGSKQQLGKPGQNQRR